MTRTGLKYPLALDSNALLMTDIVSDRQRYCDEDYSSLPNWDLPYPNSVLLTLNDTKYQIDKFPSVSWIEKMFAKLSHISYLKYNWDNRGASIIRTEIILASIRLICSVVNSGVPEPYIFPTPLGGIQFEWHTNEVDLEIEITGSNVIILFETRDGIDEEWDVPYYLSYNKIQEIVAKIS